MMALASSGSWRAPHIQLAPLLADFIESVI
jgi:hypothetical protein